MSTKLAFVLMLLAVVAILAFAVWAGEYCAAHPVKKENAAGEAAPNGESENVYARLL